MANWTADAEIKTVDLQRRLITAYAAAHNNIDRVRDIIDPQATVKAVSRIKQPADIPVFLGHSEDQLPVGIPQRIEAHPRGLYTETLVKPGPVGDDLLHTARFHQQQGVPLGLSIKYRVRDSRHEQTSRGRIRRILDYDLAHYCFASPAVTANPEAVVTDVKTRHKALAEGTDSAGGFLVPADAKAEEMPCAACRAGQAATCECAGCQAGEACTCCAQLAREEAKMQYRIARQGTRFAVYCDTDDDGDADDDHLIGTYASQAVATQIVAALQKHEALTADAGAEEQDTPDPSLYDKTGRKDGKTMATGRAQMTDGGEEDQKAVLSTEEQNQLPDSAFLYIEPGGTKDEDGRTVPRSHRHLPYRTAGGAIDLPHLRNAISRLGQEATLPGLDAAKKAALQARARALLEKQGGGTSTGAKTLDLEAEGWQGAGSPLAIRGVAYRLLDLSEVVADEHKAMRLLGEETKAGMRIREGARREILALVGDLKALVAWAETIDRGEDGQAKLRWYRQQLALTEV